MTRATFADAAAVPVVGHREPIVAIATAPGRGAVGIVRVSGRDLSVLIQAVCGRRLQPRQATLLDFAGSDGQPLDRGLAIHFPAPHSYTGEDVLELQAHGGPVVLQLLLSRCLEAGAHIGLRLAAPGEFTERAFLNDKIDLAQAEAVADLIDASTEAAARGAAQSLTGAFSAEIDAVADRTVRLRTLVEATLDFPEEEIDFLEQAGARAQLDAIAAAIDTALARARHGALLRDGLRVVIAGQPNVGKSSLLNALAGAELAIVTPLPGTTRDRISQTIQIDGVPLHVTDTAGLRADADVADAVERIGIERAWQAAAEADVVLFVHDVSRRGDAEYDRADAAIAARLPPKVLQVWNKIDTVAGAAAAADAGAVPAAGGAATTAAPDVAMAAAAPAAVALSVRTGAGLQQLRQALLAHAGWLPPQGGVVMARARHLQALRQARQHLSAAQAHAAAGDTSLELLAEELRLAHEALGAITGSFSSDDLLGEIFGSFCIGK